MRVRSLASLSGLRIQHFLELRCRSAAAALIGPLAWELAYATGVALKKKENNKIFYSQACLEHLNDFRLFYFTSKELLY